MFGVWESRSLVFRAATSRRAASGAQREPQCQQGCGGRFRDRAELEMVDLDARPAGEVAKLDRRDTARVAHAEEAVFVRPPGDVAIPGEHRSDGPQRDP